MAITKNGRVLLGIGIVALIISTAPAALAKKPKTVKGTSAGSFSTVNFSFDGAEPGTLSNVTGKDNLNGPFSSQTYAEYGSAGPTCTAPDGTTGNTYTLVGSWTIITYKSGELLVAGSQNGSECVSNSTGFFGGTSTYTITGGTGKFTGASGTGTAKFSGVVLFAGTGPAYGLLGTVVTSSTTMLTP